MSTPTMGPVRNLPNGDCGDAVKEIANKLAYGQVTTHNEIAELIAKAAESCNVAVSQFRAYIRTYLLYNFTMEAINEIHNPAKSFVYRP
ncbi:MAG: hypothetical protein JWN33_470 [Candidatus Saccharibacteria bacterium]|nr:hypothetical protein [Candidatus Saccharibacteria bacterium]